MKDRINNEKDTSIDNKESAKDSTDGIDSVTNPVISTKQHSRSIFRQKSTIPAHGTPMPEEGFKRRCTLS